MSLALYRFRTPSEHWYADALVTASAAMPIPVPRVAVLVGVRSSTFCCFPDFNVIMTGRRSESGRPNGRHFQYRLRTLLPGDVRARNPTQLAGVQHAEGR